MRLFRPYVPLAVRIQVVEQQFPSLTASALACPDGVAKRRWLAITLRVLFLGAPYQLDHDPALVNRKINKRTGKYTPDANDPRYLVYRTKADHDTKTRLRGDHGQYSDLALVRKRKRRDRKLARASDTRPKVMRPKRKWPSRKFQTRRTQP